MFAFTATVLNAADGADAYAPWTTPISTTPGQSFIEPQHVIVTNAEGKMNLNCTVAIRLARAAGLDLTVATSSLTAAHVNTQSELICQTLSMNHLLHLFAHADLPVVFRSGDCMTEAEFNALQCSAVILNQARNLTTAIAASPAHLAAMTAHVPFATYALIANSICRETDDGHNWRNANMESSAANRAIGVAGGYKTEFAAYMMTWGHDGWHALTDASLKAIATAVSGAQPLAMPAVDFTWSGENVNARFLHEVLSVGQAAQDRYPPGTVGIAGLIIGLEMVGQMLVEISMKVEVSTAVASIKHVKALTDYVKTTALTRTDILELRNAYGSLIATAVGFVGAATIEGMNKGKSLKPFTSNHENDKAVGETLKKLLSRVVASNESIASAIAALMGTLNAASAAIGALPNVEVLAEVAEVALPETEEDREDERDRTRRALRAAQDKIDPAVLAALKEAM